MQISSQGFQEKSWIYSNGLIWDTWEPITTAKGMKYVDWPGPAHVTNPKALWDRVIQ